MLSALLTTLALAGPATHASAEVPPLDTPVPGALGGLDVRLSVELTSTHMLARSRATAPVWIVFEAESLGLQEIVRIDPGAHVLVHAPAHAAPDMTLEVVAFTDVGRLLRSGETLRSELQDRPTFYAVTDGGLRGWARSHGGRSLSRVGTRHAAAHVPVPLPSEGNRRSKRRPIERKKLPPV